MAEEKTRDQIIEKRDQIIEENQGLINVFNLPPFKHPTITEISVRSKMDRSLLSVLLGQIQAQDVVMYIHTPKFHADLFPSQVEKWKKLVSKINKAHKDKTTVEWQEGDGVLLAELCNAAAFYYQRNPDDFFQPKVEIYTELPSKPQSVFVMIIDAFRAIGDWISRKIESFQIRNLKIVDEPSDNIIEEYDESEYDDLEDDYDDEDQLEIDLVPDVDDSAADDEASEPDQSAEKRASLLAQDSGINLDTEPEEVTDQTRSGSLFAKFIPPEKLVEVQAAKAGPALNRSDNLANDVGTLKDFLQKADVPPENYPNLAEIKASEDSDQTAKLKQLAQAVRSHGTAGDACMDFLHMKMPIPDGYLALLEECSAHLADTSSPGM